MYKKVEIRGFRGLRELRLSGLSRINLIIGLNNSGKSSILEALSILHTSANPRTLARIMLPRREFLASESSWRGNRVRLDIRRLFSGHEIRLGSKISCQSQGDEGNRSLQLSIATSADNGATTTTTLGPAQIDLGDTLPGGQFLEVQATSDYAGETWGHTYLGMDGGLPVELDANQLRDESEHKYGFVALTSPFSASLALGWSSVALTPQQKTVEDALRLIEPDLEQIAFVQDATLPEGVFKVKLKNQSVPVPLGSMGEGMSRLLALIIGLVRSRNGILLVDEIDTGLHHSAMGSLWKAILETALKLNVQVFATTHSWDCVAALAQICGDQSSVGEQNVAMHRVERGNPETICYSEPEILSAIEQRIETR